MGTFNDNTVTTRADVGKLFAVIAAVLAVITPVPGLCVLGTTEFAQDFTSGTHTADLTGLYASGWMALGTVVFAVLAAIVGKGGARITGVLLLTAPVACLLLLR